MALEDLINKYNEQQKNKTTIMDGEDVQDTSVPGQQSAEQYSQIVDVFNQLKGNVYVEQDLSSEWEGFKEAYNRAETFTYNASVYMNAEYTPMLAGELQLFNEETGDLQFPDIKTPQDLYGADWYDISPEERRERINNRRGKILQNWYGEGTVSSGASRIAGTILGVLSDPSTAAPLGASLPGAVISGGLVGGADVAAINLAKEGKLDPEDIALGATVGAAAGTLLMYAGRGITSFIRARKATGEPVTAEEVVAEAKKYGVPDEEIGDVDSWVKVINEQIDPANYNPLKPIIDPNTPGKAGKLDPNLQSIVFDQRMKAAKMGPPTEAEMIKNKQIEDMWAKRNDGDKGYVSETQIQKDILTYKKQLIEESPVLGYKTPTPTNPAMKEALTKALDLKGKAVDDFQQINKAFRQSGGVQQELLRDISFSGIGALTGYAYDGEEGAMFGAVAGLGISRGSQIGRKVYNAVGKMRNPKTPPLPEEIEDMSKKFATGMIGSKPETAFASYGKEGMIFNELFKKANEDLNRRLSSKLIDIKKAFYDQGILQKKFFYDKQSPEYKQIPMLLNKTLDPKNASKEAIAAANTIKKIFNQTLTDAVKHKVITPKRADELKTAAAKDGYWPRIYNEFYLNSKTGKQKWLDTLSSWKWKEADAIKSLKTITDSPDLKKAIIEGKFIKDGQAYRMSKKFAQELYDKRREVATSTRSAHLEKTRKILLPDEVLTPFLVDDPMTIMADYLRDTYKRISMAEWFGAKDQAALAIFDSVGKKIGPDQQKSMQEVYYTMAGDVDASATVKAYVNMPDLIKDIYGRAMAFETLKLMFAPIVNATQSTLNGTTMLMRMTGNPIRTVSVYGKALGNLFSQEGRDYARRVGATAESTLMQAMGDITANQHSVIHGEAAGIFSFFNVLNQPTKFLKANGFTSVENIQRILGANMGKALVEDIFEKEAKMAAQEAAGRGLSKSQMALQNKHKKILAELGITPTNDINKVPVEDLERASQRFSNELNFVNTPDQMPILLQNPYVKPFMQFKSFVVKHTAFLNKNVLKPLREDGNPFPLFTYLGVGTVAGMGVDEARRWLLADDKNYTFTEKMLRGILSVGGLGLMSDIASNAAYGEGSLATWLVGPAMSDLFSGTASIYKSVVDKDPNEFYKFGANIIPYPMRNEVRESLKKKSNSDSFYDGLYNGDFYK